MLQTPSLASQLLQRVCVLSASDAFRRSRLAGAEAGKICTDAATPSLASQLLQRVCVLPASDAFRRSRLAGEEARKICSDAADAFAGKPAPTG
ncbi:hypothetical protein FW796_22785 [Pseudomonas sp. 910_21]